METLKSRAGHGIGTLAMIWAQDVNGVIGADGGMVWHVPADFKHFRNSTLNCPIIMGRSSFEALGEPLPERDNLVLTTKADWNFPGVIRVSSLEEAFAWAAKKPLVWITGGGEVYRQALPYADVLVVSYLELEVPKEKLINPVYAPEIDTSIWELDQSQSDFEWRERSGDARWKISTYRRSSL